MSYFIFGSAVCNDPDHADAAAKRLSDSAADCGVSVLVEANINQKVVLDMLDEQEPRSPATVHYALVGSSQDDTADSLISPCYYGPGWEEPVERRLLAVQEWLSRILDLEFVTRVRIYATEGFDNRFATKTVAVDSLAKTILLEMSKIQDVPSLKLEIETP